MNKDSTSINKDIFSSSVYTYAQYIISFLGQIYIARILVPEIYGHYALIISYVAIFELISSFSFSESYIQSEEKKETFESVFILTLFIILFRLVLIILFILGEAIFFKNQFFTILMVLFFSKMIVPMNKIILINIEKKYGLIKSSKVLCLANILSIILAVFLATKNFGIWSLIIKEVFPTVIIFLLYFPTSLRFLLNIKKPTLKNLIIFKSLTKYSIEFFFARGSEQLFAKIPNLIIEKYFGTITLGFMHQMVYIINIPSRFLNHLNQKAAFLYLSKYKYDNNTSIDLVFKFSMITLAVTLPIALTIYLYSDKIINLILGPKWIEASLFLKYLSVYLVSLNMFNIFQSSLYGIGKNSKIIIIYLLGFFMICLSIFFIISNNLKVQYIGLSYSVVQSIMLFFVFFVWRKYIYDK